MEKVELQFGSQAIEVRCEDKARILELADKVNKEINILQDSNPTAHILKIALLTALTLQHKIDTLELELLNLKSTNNNIERDIQSPDAILTQMVENVIIFIEEVANKFENANITAG